MDSQRLFYPVDYAPAFPDNFSHFRAPDFHCGTVVRSHFNFDRTTGILPDNVSDLFFRKFPGRFSFLFPGPDRHDHDLLAVGVDLVLNFSGLEVLNCDDRPGKVLLDHPVRHLDCESQHQDLCNLSFVNKNDRVHYLRDYPQFHPSDQALDCVHSPGCVHDSDHPDPGQAHVRKNKEIIGLPDLIVNRIIRSHQEQEVCSIFHPPVQGRILGNLRRHLQVPGGFHSLDHLLVIIQVACNPGCKSRLTGSRGPGDENTPLTFDAFFQFIAQAVMFKVHDNRRADHGNLHVIGKRRMGDCNPHVPDLQDSCPGRRHFNKGFGVDSCPFDKLFGNALKFRH